MSERRRYTKRQKATAVIAAEMSSVAAAAEETGIPETTLAYWMDKPEFVALRAKTRADMAEGFQIITHRAQERLVELIPTMDARDLTILLGVATDKGQLLSGGATDRVETREILHDFGDGEREALHEWLMGIARERMAADA